MAATSLSRLARGLAEKQSYFTIQRDAMDIDRLKTPALYFGTTTGQLWIGRERDEQWEWLSVPCQQSTTSRSPSCEIELPEPRLSGDSGTGHETINAVFAPRVKNYTKAKTRSRAVASVPISRNGDVRTGLSGRIQ